MRIAIMKWADHWLGWPACCLLGCFLKMKRFFSFGRAQRVRQPRKIVISKFFGIGSIVLAMPLVESLRRRYPNARIVFLTFSSNAALLSLYGLKDDAITISNASPASFIWDVLGVLLRLSISRADIAIDLEFYSKFSTLMASLSGAPKRIGFYLPCFWRKSLVTHPVNFNYNRHISEIYAAVAQAAGVEEEVSGYVAIALSSSVKQRMHGVLTQHGFNGRDVLVGINVNASDLAYCRRWGADKFAAVIEKIIVERNDVTILLTGSPGEQTYVTAFYNELAPHAKQKVLNVAGRFSLEEFLSCIAECAVYITNDSGPLHLAAVMATPTVSLWGPGTPSLYGPVGPRHTVIYSRFPCSPCMYMYRTNAGYFCDNQAPCMERISPDEVAQGALAHLRKISVS